MPWCQAPTAFCVLLETTSPPSGHAPGAPDTCWEVGAEQSGAQRVAMAQPTPLPVFDEDANIDELLAASSWLMPSQPGAKGGRGCASGREQAVSPALLARNSRSGSGAMRDGCRPRAGRRQLPNLPAAPLPPHSFIVFCAPCTVRQCSLCVQNPP